MKRRLSTTIKLVAGAAALTAAVMLRGMMPELVRYLRIRRM
jgi:hypothetical protein